MRSGLLASIGRRPGESICRARPQLSFVSLPPPPATAAGPVLGEMPSAERARAEAPAGAQQPHLSRSSPTVARGRRSTSSGLVRSSARPLASYRSGRTLPSARHPRRGRRRAARPAGSVLEAAPGRAGGDVAPRASRPQRAASAGTRRSGPCTANAGRCPRQSLRRRWPRPSSMTPSPQRATIDTRDAEPARRQLRRAVGRSARAPPAARLPSSCWCRRRARASPPAASRARSAARLARSSRPLPARRPLPPAPPIRERCSCHLERARRRQVAERPREAALSRRCFNPRISRLSLLGAARAFIVLVALGTVVTMALLWPAHVGDTFSEVVQPSDKATVTGIDDRPCGATVSDRCVRVLIDARQRRRGRQQRRDPVERQRRRPGGPRRRQAARRAGARRCRATRRPTRTTYTLVDFQRGPALVLLFVIFARDGAAAVTACAGRCRCSGSPSASRSCSSSSSRRSSTASSPVAVAIAGSLAIGMAAIFLAHGRGPKSLAAMLGTIVSLLLTAAAGAPLHPLDAADRPLRRGVVRAAPRRPDRLAPGPADRRHDHRRAGRPRRRHREPVLDGLRAPRRQPGDGLPRALPRRDGRRQGPRRRDRQHARARLRRLVAAGAADLRLRCA